MSDKKPTVALAMIVKDEVKEIEQILRNYGKLFDEIQITVTCKDKQQELYELIQKHGGNPTYFDWIDDFAAARNFNKAKVKSDYMFRLDSDDSIKNPQNIREMVNKAVEHDMSIVYCYYVYSTDENGATNAVHYRETLIKNTDNLYWNKTIHENILPRSRFGYNIVMDDSVQIVHNIKPDHAEKSSERNLKYLIKEYNRDKEKTDPRTIAYLGRMFLGMGEFEKAKFFLLKHIEHSGWDEDRYISWCYLSEIFKHEKNYKEAIGCANEALQERPDFPDAYLKLHDIYFDQSQWDKAIHWGKMGLARKMPKTFMLLDPSAYGWRPILSLSFCYFQKSDFETALKLFNAARAEAPNIDFIKSNAKIYEEAVDGKRFTEHFAWLLQYLKVNDKEKVPALFDAVPKKQWENEAIKQLKTIHSEPVTWSSKSIVIFCGPTFEDWSPKIVETGIGGSEEAVIYMAQEWKKMGYEVTVFNACGDQEGDYDGVTYKSYYHFNPRDSFNVLICWRCNIFDGISAKRKICWYHDVPHADSFNTKEEIASFDKLVVLSKFHRTLFPYVPDEKILISTNGLKAEDFDFSQPEERNPKRLIWASSYNRGLKELLEVWPSVRNAVPDAELHVFYGWDSYLSYAKNGLASLEFKAEVDKLMQQEGVIHHGRVGHKQLVSEYRKSGIFAYPCTYDEINCIALSKAIASGCKAVTSDVAAVGERNTVGVAVPLKDYKKTLIRVLKGEINVRTYATPEEYLKTISWKVVAKEWRDSLFADIGDYKLISDRLAWIRSQVNKDEKIVDIGGNDGHTFNGAGFDKVTTVDIDLYDIPHFVLSDAQSLPFSDKEYDVAVLAEILEHVPNPVKAMSEARRVAKRTVITVPYEHEWDEELRPFATVESNEAESGKTRQELAKKGNPLCKEFHTEDNLEHLWHHRHYTKETLEADLREAGYKNIKIEKLVCGKWVFYGGTASE